MTASEVVDVTLARKKKRKRKAAGDPVMSEDVKEETNEGAEESFSAKGEDSNFMHSVGIHCIAYAVC